VDEDSVLFVKVWYLFFAALYGVVRQGGSYAIVFELKGLAVDGDASAAYDVNTLREGEMCEISLSALVAPSTANLRVMPYLIGANGVQADILTKELQLPIGQTKAVYSILFAVPTGLTRGMKLVNVITISGDAEDVTTEIVVRRVLVGSTD